MIRYADKKDIEILKCYDKHISESELKNSIKIKRVLMIFENNIFIGWLRYNLFWDNTPFMNMLYILEDYRNKGYRQQLMNYWEEEMLKMNYKRVLTSTLSNEGAQFFYRKNGYIDCGSLLLPKETLEITFMKNLL